MVYYLKFVVPNCIGLQGILIFCVNHITWSGMKLNFEKKILKVLLSNSLPPKSFSFFSTELDFSQEWS